MPPARKKVERSQAWHKAMHAKRALTDNQERALVRDYMEGVITLKEISKRYGVSVVTIYGVLKRYGKGDMRRGRGSHGEIDLTKQQKRAIWKEYVSGELSLWKLAEKHGINESTIYSIGDELGETYRRRPSHRHKPRIFTLKESQEIWEEYMYGDLTVDELAEKYGVHKATLYDMFHRLGKSGRRQAGAGGAEVTESGRFKKQQRAKKLYPRRGKR